MEGIKDRRSRATSHLYWTTIITVAEKKKRIQKPTKELIGFWDMFPVSFQHMAAVRY